MAILCNVLSIIVFLPHKISHNFFCAELFPFLFVPVAKSAKDADRMLAF